MRLLSASQAVVHTARQVVIAEMQTVSQCAKTVIPDKPGAAGRDLESSMADRLVVKFRCGDS